MFSFKFFCKLATLNDLPPFPDLEKIKFFHFFENNLSFVSIQEVCTIAFVFYDKFAINW